MILQSKLPNDNRWTTLCPELIYEIIAYCLSDTPLDTCFPDLFPWYLGHICRSWRSVFISSPRFWNRFIFDGSVTGAFEADYLERALTLVELCVKRTKDQSFSFRFNPRTHGYVETSYMCQAMKTLVAHADRWSAASIKIKGSGGVEELLLKAKHHFRQLQTLHISISPGTSYHLDLFEDAPNLTRVYTTDYYRLRWSSLTVLHISSHTFVKLFIEFDKMTCLQELVIRGSPLQRERVLQTPVEIHSLKILYVNHYYPLSFIRAPSLETLHLGDILPVLRRTSIETFLRGVSHLRTLSFNVNVCTVLDCFPELDHVIVGIFVLPVLVYKPIARSLKMITISDTDLHERGAKTLGELTSMVKHWEKYQFPNLRRLSVYVYDGGEEDMSPAIDDLVRLGVYKGFEVDIKFSPFQVMPLFRDL
ncbi:hypothetical protein F5887DRAFT_1075546 [Amanita rubescens]|nr:hypothetical protein F5887DRAFT_1082340 [Amanita rubescens]KAF8343659.1 hypothetical protein F5887DRAFT_1075546 [Amanita rubescens]